MVPRISVIIPTYNRQSLVLQAIETVLAQTFQDFEVIVVDDGSTDATEQCLEQFKGKIVYLKTANRGVAAARNSGIRLAGGEFICFLDSDDVWEPSKLQAQIEFADANPQYALIATEVRALDVSQKLAGGGKAAIYQIKNGMVADSLLFGNWIFTSSVMVRRSALDITGWFDEDVGQFGEDWLLWMKIAVRFPIYFIPDVLSFYRFQEDSLSVYRPEAQFVSLMKCVSRLAELPYFKERPDLIRRVQYRICMIRANSNLYNREYRLAGAKIRSALMLNRWSLSPYALMLKSVLMKTMGKIHPGYAARD
jgi:glycosyltransferase involved in cell wall biosynthesis